MKIKLMTIVVAAGVAAYAAAVPADETYGRGLTDVVRHADGVEAQRASVEFPRSAGGTRVVKIYPKGDKYRLSAESIALLRSAFLKESEADQATKLCVPVPGVRYVFRARSGNASILVCYKCRIALIERDGHVLREAYVDHIIDDLRKVAGSFLPEEEVAKLP